jgi:hypothetical protein
MKLVEDIESGAGDSVIDRLKDWAGWLIVTAERMDVNLLPVTP